MSEALVESSPIGNELTKFLVCADITPGDQPSYQMCKTIMNYHPLGQKMTESPVKFAQSQEREIVVEAKGATDLAKEAFTDEWVALNVDTVIRNVKTQSRAYGAASVAILAEGVPTDRPLDLRTLPDLKIAFNVFDPLNTAGSLVLNQNPNAFDFQKAIEGIRVQGTTYHPSRTCIVLNGEPIYIAYTGSSFGYVGRSVFQRGLFPLKSFVNTMVTDDMISRKAGVLVVKQEVAGSIVDSLMGKVAAFKGALLKAAQVGNVLTIGLKEEAESLNLQNLDGAFGMARTNILKNIATSCDMPAWFLENETMVGGFGEGEEDAKNIAHYIDGLRKEMRPLYAFFDEIVMARAWSPAFFERIKRKFPEDFEKVGYAQFFYDLKNSFSAIWPNLLTEPDSEKSKTEDARLKGIAAAVETLSPLLDPVNKATLVTWAADEINQNKTMFKTKLVFDADLIEEYVPPAEMAEKEAGEPPAPKPMSAAA